jgi:hypothetical protein
MLHLNVERWYETRAELKIVYYKIYPTNSSEMWMKNYQFRPKLKCSLVIGKIVSWRRFEKSESMQSALCPNMKKYKSFKS